MTTINERGNFESESLFFGTDVKSIDVEIQLIKAIGLFKVTFWEEKPEPCREGSILMEGMDPRDVGSYSCANGHNCEVCGGDGAFIDTDYNPLTVFIGYDKVKDLVDTVNPTPPRIGWTLCDIAHPGARANSIATPAGQFEMITCFFNEAKSINKSRDERYKKA